jgi:hypothetical protein
MSRDRVTSKVGVRESLNGRTIHDGIDLAVPVGTPIYTNKELTVTHATTLPGYGNVVYARDNLGTEYRFAHLDSIPDNVKPGAVLSPGSQVAYSGISGEEKNGKQTSTGAHLHYEVRQGGKPIDPLTTIDPATGKPYVANASFDKSGRSLVTSDITKDPNYTPNGTASAPLRSNRDPSGRTPTPRSLKPDANQSPAETNRLNNYAPPPPGIRAPMINPLLQLGDR